MKQLWISVIKPRTSWSKWLLFLTILAIIGLGYFGYLEKLKQFADSEALTLTYGEFQLSLYDFLKVVLLIVLLFWSAASLSDIAEKRIQRLERLRSTNRALILKFVQIGIYIVSFLLALDILGIDLTALTVFSGALGIGLGFGLQKIASNFISGIILLFEKSVEEDDLMEMSDGTFGFVRKAHARFMLVETMDGKEMMIPNEDFIVNRVTNWTYSNTKARVRVDIGVSYGSDLEIAKAIMLESAKEHPRCMPDPEPACFLRTFGNSSIDFTLFFWVENVIDGRWGPQSDVMMEIWRRFKSEGIEIPFPQRDLHIKNLNTEIPQSIEARERDGE